MLYVKILASSIQEWEVPDGRKEGKMDGKMDAA